jgi:hypothetical protein
VKQPRDARFEQERVALNLRFECEDCVYFDPPNKACVHGYPTLEHRAQVDGDGTRLLVFCKEFEIA